MPQILAHGDGYFIFRFDLHEDYDKVMLGDPYTYHNKPFIIQAWTRNFEFNSDCIITIPIWVTLPSVLVGYWSSDALSKIPSAIGSHYTRIGLLKLWKESLVPGF